MKEVSTEIEVDTGVEQIWKILTDFDRYEEWNPFIYRIIGQPKEGGKIEIHIRTPGGKQKKYKPIVTKVEEGKELRWFGKSLLPGFLNGEHIFIIDQIRPGRVRLVHREIFDGLLVSVFGRSLDTDIKQGFEEMNRALKKKAEHAATRNA